MTVEAKRGERALAYSSARSEQPVQTLGTVCLSCSSMWPRWL